MKLKNIAIEERISKTGAPYYVLIAITDEEEGYNKKLIGFVGRNEIRITSIANGTKEKKGE